MRFRPGAFQSNEELGYTRNSIKCLLSTLFRLPAFVQTQSSVRSHFRLSPHPQLLITARRSSMLIVQSLLTSAAQWADAAAGVLRGPGVHRAIGPRSAVCQASTGVR